MEPQILVARGSNWAFALEEPLEVGPNVVRPFRLRFNGTNGTLQSRCVQPPTGSESQNLSLQRGWKILE